MNKRRSSRLVPILKISVIVVNNICAVLAHNCMLNRIAKSQVSIITLYISEHHQKLGRRDFTRFQHGKYDETSPRRTQMHMRNYTQPQQLIACDMLGLWSGKSKYYPIQASCSIKCHTEWEKEGKCTYHTNFFEKPEGINMRSILFQNIKNVQMAKIKKWYKRIL